jgi:hypothetical protein
MRKWLNPEIVLGFLIATIFWATILGWQAAYAPTEQEKDACNQAAKQTGHKTEECKSLWEKTTTDPVPLFTLVLAFSTIGLWVATTALYLAGERQLKLARENADQQSRDMQASIAVAKQSAIDQQRAWLSIKDVSLEHPTKFSQDEIVFRVQATAQNFGGTPAMGAEIYFESYFPEKNPEEFADAKERFKQRLRATPLQLGSIVFPDDNLQLRWRWTDEHNKIKNAIRDMSSGEKRIGFVIFVGVTYRVKGDEIRHITIEMFSMLDVPIGTEIKNGETIKLKPMPFLSGEAD